MCLQKYGRRTTDFFSRSFLYCCLVTAALMTTVTGQGNTWVSRPQDQSILVGGRVKFLCEASGPNITNYIWTKGTKVIFINGQRNSGVPTRYIVENKNDLVINSVELDDDSLYTCDFFGFESSQVKLTVLLPPGPASITTNSSSSQLVENSVITFTCSSTGGKPAPTIQWLRNGQLINSATMTPPSEERGTTSSQITLTLNREDDHANISCIVFNAANKNSPKLGTQILDVQYSPSITFEPKFSPYRVEQNNKVDLHCIVDANPNASSIQWFKNEGRNQAFVSSGRTLSFNSIQKSDSGNYSCKASNTINAIPRQTQASVYIDVIYAPTVTTRSVLTVNISEQVNMTCSVDANPPATTIQWEKINTSDIRTNGPNFVFVAKKIYDGNYSCTAFSRLEPSGKPAKETFSKGFTVVKVQYAPGQASISPISSAIVGQSITLTCNIDDAGYPPPNFIWKRAGTSIILQSTLSPVYRVAVAKLADNGNYTCLPTNLMGDGRPATITVEVNSPPMFISSNPTTPVLTVPIDQSNLLLEHKIEGRPKPMVRWYKDGVPLSDLTTLYRVDTSSIIVEQYKHLVTTRISFVGSGRNQNRLRIEDNGNFTCQVTSSASATPRSKTILVSVEFPPVITMATRVAVELNQTVTMQCITQANPTPTFSWFRGNRRLTDGGRLSMTTSETSGIAQYQGHLRITGAVESDFGDYTCDVSNTKGQIKKSVTLSKKNKPEPPYNLASIDRTWESVHLKWQPGFDGGYTQTFFISIRSIYGDDTQEVYPVTATSFNVTRLMPHTSYTFHVYGRNKLGQGGNSDGLTAQTDILVFPPLKEIPEFEVEDNQLKIPNDLNQSYCIRVEISLDNGKVWDVVQPCVTASEKTVGLTSQSATNVNVSVCLVYRPEVCGEPVVSKIHQPSTPDLTETEVIIIGCVCAAILIVLLIVLICIICKRRQRNKNYNNDPHSPRTVPQGNGAIPNQFPRGYDNKDSVVHNDNRNGFMQPYFSTGEQYPVGDTSFDSHTLDKHYEYEMNRRNANNTVDQYHNDKNYQGDLSFSGSPRTPTKDPQQYINVPEDQKHEGGSFGSGQESGYSTPDPAKPKKVIYEVVV